MSSAIFRRRALAAALFSFAGCAHAQEVIWDLAGNPNTHGYGISVVVGDIDGDGYDDLANTMSVWQYPPCSTLASEIWFLSGRDGHVIRVRPRVRCLWTYRLVVAAGDVDGDGGPDYAVVIFDQDVATGSGYHVEVCSARDDRLLWSVHGPHRDDFANPIAAGLDLDGDRRPDLVAAAALVQPYGRLYAYSSRGALLYQVDGTASLPFTYRSHQCIARIGDLDGDGCDDYGVGSNDASTRGFVAVLSGRSGRLIRQVFGEFPGDWLGTTISACGDIDRDGVPDFAASSIGIAFCCRGVAHTFSGATGQRIHTWVERHYGAGFGFFMTSGVDLDQDGINDVVVGAPSDQNSLTYGAIYIYSGRDGALLSFLGAYNPGWLEAIPAQPDHPFPGFVTNLRIAAPPDPLVEPRRLLRYRGNPPGVRPLGDGCLGSLLAEPRMGLRDLRAGSPSTPGIRISLEGAPSGSLGALMVGLSNSSWLSTPLPLALAPAGLPGCSLFTSVDLACYATAGNSGAAAGFAALEFGFPLVGGGLGVFSLHGQWVVLDPTGLRGAVSNALTWTYR